MRRSAPRFLGSTSAVSARRTPRRCATRFCAITCWSSTGPLSATTIWCGSASALARSSRPEVWVVSNIRMDGKLVGALPDGEMSFHFDRIHQKQPNKAGVLHAIEIPRKGGDTLFADMCRAYETLPDKTKARLAGLTARNVYEYGSVTAGGPISPDAPRAVHPVVRTVPETGRKALYVCRLMSDRINELAPDESRALIDE